METIYVAYGSNMNIDQMTMRCPTARLLGTAVLKGWRLRFRGMENNAVATIEPSEGSNVLAVLWELQPKDEAALDRYEGYPIFYRKETVKVEFEGQAVNAMVYIMNPGRQFGKPGSRYYEIIRQGYKEAGFDSNILVKAVMESAFYDAKRKKPD